MVIAAIVSLEEFRQAQARAHARGELHERFDRWLDSMEEKLPDKTPSLEELPRTVFDMRQELTGVITESLVVQRYGQALKQQSMGCSQCGRTLRARQTASRRMKTMVGKVSLQRPYFYCVQCEKGFYPLDEALELSERRKQWDIQKAGASLAVEVPFEAAQALFSELTGLSLSDHTTHEIVGELSHDLTVLDVSPSTEEVSQRVAEVAQGKKWRPIMVLAIDGAYVPTRPEKAKGHGGGRKRKRARRARWQGEWKEAKGFRFYLVDKDRIVHLLSWHQIQTNEGVADALRQVKEAGLVPEEKVRLCVIGDGAKWIWNQVQSLFPTAVEVLDYYHCAEHLYKVAVAQFGDDPVRGREWAEVSKARLFFGFVDWVIEDLGNMKPEDEQTTEEIRKLSGYLRENRGRVNYGSLRKGGYPIGSGAIESANKAISHVRLKRSGAWWYVEQANQMLALRCAKYNGTFERVFEAYKWRVIESRGRPPS